MTNGETVLESLVFTDNYDAECIFGSMCRYAAERQLRTPHRLEFRSLRGEMPNFREYSRLN